MFFTNRFNDPFADMEKFLFNSSVKDMQPYATYKQENAIIIEVKTLGINPENISVTLDNNLLRIAGETASAYSDKSFNTKLDLRLDDDLMTKIERIKYKSLNGLTYITLVLKKENPSQINIEQE